MQMMDTKGRLVGKVNDIFPSVGKMNISLLGGNEGGAIQSISWKDDWAINSISRFFHYFAAQTTYSKGQVLISEVEGKAVGFAKLAEFHLCSDKFGCILGLAVHPHFRRKGVATALVNAGTKSLKIDGARAVFATAETTNIGSLAVFNNVGFKRMGFLGLRRLFGWRVFEVYRTIRFALGQTVLMYD